MSEKKKTNGATIVGRQRVKAQPSPNPWETRHLFAESKTLESEIKKQLAGLRYE